MKVWKIASRWSDDGNPASSVLDLFKKYSIAFVSSQRAYNEIEINDLVAISDGEKIISVAKVIRDPYKITELPIKDKDKIRFPYEDRVTAIRLNMYNLCPNEIFKYKKRGRFHALKNEESEKVKRLYEKYHEIELRELGKSFRSAVRFFT